MSFLQPTDFIGIYNISVNDLTEFELQDYIDRFEVRYLTDLLGCDMYDDFIADLDTAPLITTASVPVDPKFTVIFDAFCIDEDANSGCQHVSEGFKEMLKAFIYFEYVRDNQVTMSITGATKNTYSNSEAARIWETRIMNNYNLGIRSYQEIQWYICDNPVPYDYDNYNGISKQPMSWL